ncbi:hypothetical protein OG834_34180 [Streptomyces mirabilis]|uniref:hypothetical protein n=1 Tax=Streptomyces mirabilis TaxID=68239 RepID=UPI002E2C12CC|nr:hypothetical protein [Streptomyces mirabilis]MCX4435895.1 hypothetical protein [Streptomyces mirabilis]
MGFFDKLTGTRYPDSDVVLLSAMELWTALLALNGLDVRFRVRNALPKEKADLVAECRIREVGVALKTRMRLNPEKHEVRFLDERWEHRSSDHGDAQYGRGHAPAMYRQWETKQGPDGRRRKVETFCFDTREMTDPLRNVVLGAGWTWRGVLKL